MYHKASLHILFLGLGVSYFGVNLLLGIKIHHLDNMFYVVQMMNFEKQLLTFN